MKCYHFGISKAQRGVETGPRPPFNKWNLLHVGYYVFTTGGKSWHCKKEHPTHGLLECINRTGPSWLLSFLLQEFLVVMAITFFVPPYYDYGSTTIFGSCLLNLLLRFVSTRIEAIKLQMVMEVEPWMRVPIFCGPLKHQALTKPKGLWPSTMPWPAGSS